ncbi:MAG TPA: sulfite reductase subunit alpha [Stellaceae bacterium]|nr:sulfite reductase subunit alpha [Stellaceae bacterium]
MSAAQRLPDNAPFSPAQRAWLDGFLAALLDEPLERKALAIASPSAPPEPEEFPWHDPALALDERLGLAEGRPLPRALMAAMAQLDCGQCGYLCQSYAEAIAAGAETSLSRCVPGGKATSRALKELLATPAAPAAAAGALAAASPVPAIAPGEAFVARLRGATRLNGDGSERDTRHVVLASEAGPVSYQVGDAIGVRASNAPGLVEAIVAALGVSCDLPVTTPDGVERPLAEALAGWCEIRRPSDQAIEVLASRAHDRDESRILQAMAEGYPGAGPEDADLLDLLHAFPSARPPVPELIEALDPLQPRLYSIASSPKRLSREIHLTVAPVRYRLRARMRGGVASTYLCDRVEPDGPVTLFVRPTETFRLAAPDVPLIMIGPGTGVAPFRAFLQERQAVGARGRNWLFFGNPHRSTDFFYGEELLRYLDDGLLTRLDTAFSRDQEHKVYVQHRLLDCAAELWSWLEDGAHLYVCGDAERMARDVDRGFAYIIAKEGGMDAAAAKAYLARMVTEGRYRKDVY